MKVAGGVYTDWRVLERRLRGIRERAPLCQLVVDLSWSWDHAEDHAEVLSVLDGLGIDWIEDAFPRQATSEYVRAAQIATTPLGYGDEVTRVADILSLVNSGAVRVIRLDATALGGFTAVIPLTRKLVQLGMRVSLHENPEIHEHCALAISEVDRIEIFPTDRYFDMRHTLTLGSANQRIRAGCLIPATTPGLGVTLNVSQVEHFAVRHASVCA